ncbi:plasmid pRiA4b ORF-3 family protein [Alkalibacterium sp. f15]|uniref:plasmid pRiA4b ORF-3 family protein n=1 Tax=Alkalibacterium sp. f15 TaxID=3414029 RepID=UPI003BF7D9B0
MIYQFKVTLKDVGVPVWRKLQVDSETTFECFHYIILAAFDWLGYHLHEFEIRKSNGIRFSNTSIGQKENAPLTESSPYLLQLRKTLAHPEDYGLPRFFHEEDERLSDWFKEEKDRALYTYDCGDDWEHEIILEKILDSDPNASYPLCTKAKNDTPLEDSRRDLLNNQFDLTHPNGKELAQAINDTFKSEGWEKVFLDRDEFV